MAIAHGLNNPQPRESCVNRRQVTVGLTAPPPPKHERKNYQLDPNPASRDIQPTGSLLDENPGSILKGNQQLIDKRVTNPSAQLVQLSLIEIVRKRGQLALRLYIVGNLAMALTWMATGTALLANLTGDVTKEG